MLAQVGVFISHMLAPNALQTMHTFMNKPVCSLSFAKCSPAAVPALSRLSCSAHVLALCMACCCKQNLMQPLCGSMSG